MKKILISMFLLVFGVCLVGCDIESNHQHISCQECGKCIAESCDGLDEDKCQGHKTVHSHTECDECGKCIATDCDGIEEVKCSGHQHHIFKLTIIDEDNLIYDKPTETSCESDTKIVMHSRPIMDADLAMYINGEFHSIQNTIIVNDETVWEYSFIMTERDTTIEFKTQALEYFDVKTILGIPSLTREDILRIIYHTINLSSDPIPGSLRIVISTTDYEDITSMLCFLDANVVEDRSNNWQEDAGSCEKYSICTIDKKYDFEIINGYISVNNKHYKLLGYGPGMSYGNITSAFNTNLDSYEAYTLDGTKIGTFNGLSEFEFYEIDGPLTSVDDYGYLETEFGRIYIHNSKIFYIKNGESYTYYELAWEWEKDFSDIFSNHKHNECQECGKCIAEDCDGIEEEKCLGHQPTHTHTEEVLSAKEATCEENGLTEGKKCSICGEILVAQITIPSKGHNYVDGKCACGELEQKNYYFLTFDTDGGSIIETVLLFPGSTIIEPADPIKVGYTFKGWSPHLLEVMPENNVEVKAIWEPITYTVTFNDIDGTLFSTMTVSYGEKINAPADPSSEGYNFSGWHYNGEPWDFETEVKCNVKLYATWEKIRGHSLVFEGNNGYIGYAEFCYGEEIVFDLENVIDEDYIVIIDIGEYPKYMPNSPFFVSVECYDIRDLFTLSDDGLGINGYLGSGKDVIVPSGYYYRSDFIEISRVESWCFNGNKEIESVQLPDTINKIGREAFNNCWKLKTVNIPVGVEVIDYKTFSNTAIEGITIPDSVTTIVNSAFSGCEELKSIVIPNSVKEIGDSVFINCNSLVSISIPFTGNKLENPTNTYFGYIFGDYQYNKGYSSCIPMSLDKIFLTNTVDIAISAFEGVKYVNEIILSEGLKTIGEYAFADCDNLRSIVMPSTLEEIKKRAFSSCEELSEIILNEGLKKIQNAIYSGSKLMSIVIPESVEYIGSCAFGNQNMTIYCKVEEKPSEWMNDWNLIYGADYIDVVWNFIE